MWITAKTTVLFDNGTITALQHQWTFDEFFAAAAIQGLDANRDGTYDRQELASLAQTNIDGLKTFDFFTFPTLAGVKLNFDDPVDAWLDYKDSILTLHFTLPLKPPIRADAEGLSFSVYEPSFYVGVSFDKDAPISLGGKVPSGCNVRVGLAPDDAANAQRLEDALSQGLTGKAPISDNAVSIGCPAQ